jgi:hypothetical protein
VTDNESGRAGVRRREVLAGGAGLAVAAALFGDRAEAKRCDRSSVDCAVDDSDPPDVELGRTDRMIEEVGALCMCTYARGVVSRTRASVKLDKTAIDAWNQLFRGHVYDDVPYWPFDWDDEDNPLAAYWLSRGEATIPSADQINEAELQAAWALDPYPGNPDGKPRPLPDPLDEGVERAGHHLWFNFMLGVMEEEGDHPRTVSRDAIREGRKLTRCYVRKNLLGSGSEHWPYSDVACCAKLTGRRAARLSNAAPYRITREHFRKAWCQTRDAVWGYVERQERPENCDGRPKIMLVACS